jgi:hypothetical protein
MKYTSLKSIEKRLNGYILRSKRAYERNDSTAENHWANKLENELKELFTGIKIDWPGLYPCFNLKGREFYTIADLLDYLN